MRKVNHRKSRINSEVQRALSEIIQGELKDPRIDPLCSITAVLVSADLKNCKVWVSTYDEESSEETLAGLRSAEGFLRSRLAQLVNLRNTPELKFTLDESMAYGAKMAKLIDETVKKDEAK
ncbi:MAG: 30S ribosome-binding factor RbfA [Lachnospiraceae bacterium]|jgi:ribosome-binding factor A|nr:30S ribosome-binding factor RbfA [Lachnospiraceae bacterium]